MSKAHHLFLFAFFITTQFSSSSTLSPNPTQQQQQQQQQQQGSACKEFDELNDHTAKCNYLNTHHDVNSCVPQSYIRYLHLFYCTFGDSPFLGYALLSLCLLLLFYVLANTASRYFCSSLEGLSRLLSLPPTIAGVTLLSLGNGAPDVFSALASFAGSGAAGDVGISSVLGGALFVSSVVVGVISVSVGSSPSIEIDRAGFVRDVCFFLLVLCFLLGLLIAGEVGVLGSALFVSLYAVYVVAVSVPHCRGRSGADGEAETPLLDGVEVEEPPIRVVGKEEEDDRHGCCCCCCIWLIYLLQLPLYLPRRLTIPDVSEERWSKPYAAASAFLSPILLAALWNTRDADVVVAAVVVDPDEGCFAVYLFAGLAGLAMGIAALETTDSSEPPKKFLLPWLAGGFLMSVVWTYVTAGELVSLLVSMGHVLGVGPSLLGATVLAWGNSVGDLVANTAMALRGGEDGARVAVTACYAGPIFNTLVGLGTSLVLASAGARPSPYVVPADSSHFVTLGFLAGALAWALVVLPTRGMKLDRVLGVGLLAIYFCFLCLRISQSLGGL